jgi:hypothetical protein
MSRNHQPGNSETQIVASERIPTMSTAKQVRQTIITAFAKWTASSAVRAGCPIKKTKEVCKLLETVEFRRLCGSHQIGAAEFDRWHRNNVTGMQEAARKLGKPLPAGCAAKILNVYLKTCVYVGRLGRPGLLKCIHPPLDNKLIHGIRAKAETAHVSLPKVKAWKGTCKVADYDRDYAPLIGELRDLAPRLQRPRCTLFELEQYWEPDC